MKAKTKKRVQNWFIYFLIFLFVITTLLLFLPISQPAPTATAPPLTGESQGGDLTPEQQQMIQQQLQQQQGGQAPNSAPAQ